MKLSKEAKLLLLLSLACAFAVTVMIIALCTPKETEPQPFTPPPFDDNATVGVPTVPDDLGYGILYREGMSFRVGICGKLNVSADTTDVYLTNPAENIVWLKIRVFDADGNVVGESGLIRPGEYLKSISLNVPPDAIGTTALVVKVMSYEPDTYLSMGSITLTPKVSIAAQ